MNRKGQIGIYIHWPFCLAKCPYCDFNSHVRDTIDEPAWQDAYVGAIKCYSDLMSGREISSVFFGGGTPSLMNPETAHAILEAIQKHWRVSPGVEITLEANPTSVESDKFKAFRDAGINRVSLGIQSLNDKDLRFLGREHNVKEALQALDIARKTFDRFSFDLIYARPNQVLKDWRQELEKAVGYADGHLSLYQLTIERSTPFYMDHAQGKFSMPEEELAADFYHLTQDILENNSLPAYEVSNHARTGEESRHNLIYWRYGDYIGIGPGAHGRITTDGKKYATREHSAPEVWLKKMQEKGQAAHPFEELSGHDQMTEGVMMGLRLREGISLDIFADVIDQSKLSSLERQGWVKLEDERLSLKREGLLRLNAILPYILRDQGSSLSSSAGGCMSAAAS